MTPLTYKKNKSYKNLNSCYISKKEFSIDKNDNNAFKLYHKVRDHYHFTGKHRRAACNICDLNYKIPKEISEVFHKGSTFDYHFIIKDLAKKF